MTTTTPEMLARRLGGVLVEPGDPDYDTARRVWNGMIDRHPSMIVRCAGVGDVVAALEHARHNQLPITVRAGGHGVAGAAVADGALMIDLSPMRAVHVDPTNRTVRVEAGATWAMVDGQTQRFGLAVTGGVDSRTGVAGLTLGGGMGYLGRAFGLTIDNLLSAEVVLVDGRIVTTSATEHPDLFWALRGGGGNFGIVTAFEYRLHPVGPEVATAQVFYPLDEAEQVLAAYRDFLAAAPNELACYAVFVNTPPAEPFPEERHGELALALVGCSAGDVEQGAQDLAPLATFGNAFLAAVGPMAYSALQQSFDAGAPEGGRYYWKAGLLDDLTPPAIATLVEHLDQLPGPYSNVFLESMGGAIAEVDPAGTAFPHRRARFGFGISSGWERPSDDDEAIAWTRRLHEAMRPHLAGGVYSNYLDRDDGDPGDAAFQRNLDRLRQVKSAYDPDDVLHGNVRVGPASSG